MNSNREQKIRMDEMTRPSFAGLFIFYFVIFVVICIVAAFGPTMLNEKPPSGGTGVPLASRNQRCFGLEGQFERCWNHIFKFHCKPYFFPPFFFGMKKNSLQRYHIECRYFRLILLRSVDSVLCSRSSSKSKTTRFKLGRI